MLSKIIQFVKQSQYHIFLGVCILLIAYTSFNLGKINSGNKGQLKVSEGANIYQATKKQETSDQVESGPKTTLKATPKPTPKPLDMRVVVSKASDSKKYHYSWCSSWKKIKPENQIWFDTEAAAIAAGYTLAGNCTK